MDIKKLREEYQKVFNKRAFYKWGEEKLVGMIADFSKKDVVSDEEAKRIEEAKIINSKQYKIIDDSLIPVFIGGEPFCLFGETYIPYDEAEMKVQELKVQREQDKLEDLKKGRM